jgi:hypothetical protein
MNRNNPPRQPTYPVLSGDVWDSTHGFDEQTTGVVERQGHPNGVLRSAIRIPSMVENSAKLLPTKLPGLAGDAPMVRAAQESGCSAIVTSRKM